MHAIQSNAELCVRNLLSKVREEFGGEDLRAVDSMDDGSRIQLRISISKDKKAKHIAEFNFDGTSPEVYGNVNAPESVCYSAIIYCLRSLIEDDIPLNQGRNP